MDRHDKASAISAASSGSTRYQASSGSSARFRAVDRQRDAPEQDCGRGDGAGRQRGGVLRTGHTQPRERQRDARRRDDSPQQTHQRVAGRTAHALCEVANETQSRKQQHEYPQFARPDAGPRPKWSFRQQRQDHNRHHGKPSRGQHGGLVQPRDEPMKAWFFSEQQDGQCGQRRRQLELPNSTQHPCADDDDRGHFRRGIDVVSARPRVPEKDQGKRAGNQQSGGNREIQCEQEPGNAGRSSEQRKGADAAQACMRSARVTRTLALDTNGSAPKDRHDDAGDRCLQHDHH